VSKEALNDQLRAARTFGKARILVVEDDPDTMERYREILTSEGYSVRAVGLAADAVAEWMKQPADILLTDLFLPDMGGTALAYHILEIAPATGVIIATAYPSVESTVESIEKQVSAYLIKPVSRERLMISVEKTLERISLRKEKERLLGRLRDQVDDLEEVRWHKKRYFSFIVHELKRPLQAVYGATSVLSRKKWDDTEDISMVKVIRRNVHMMVEMIENILKLEQTKAFDQITDFSEMAVKPLVEAIGKNFETVLANKDLVFQVDVEPDLLITADLEKIAVIFTNLISNAVKNTAFGTITVSGCREGEKVHIEVADTGRGMTDYENQVVEDVLQRSDLRGMRTDGTGVGLSIVRDLVFLHGGEVWCESTEGKGTTFHFTIPLKYILVEEKGSVLKVRFAGRRLTSHGRSLRQLAEGLLSRQDLLEIVIDLSKVDSIASDDISVLFNLYRVFKSENKTMKLINVSWQVQELLKMTQLDQVMGIIPEQADDVTD